MTGIERLRQMAEDFKNVKTAEHCTFIVNTWRGRYIDDAIADIADQIEREQEALVADSPYDAVLPEDRDAIAWAREHGGLERVKWLLDWCLSHDSKIEQLDFDYWLSGRVMHELGFEGDMADRDEVERRLLASLTPRAGWPRYEDGEMVLVGLDIADELGETHTVTSIEFLEDETLLHWNPDEPGEFEYLHPGERVKRPAPKVLDADGVEIEVGDDLYSVEGMLKFHVSAIDTRNGKIATAEMYALDKWADPKMYTHRAPVLAADGRPLRDGETVWHVKTGREYVVVEPSYDKTVVVRLAKYDDAEGEQHAPDKLTHERPDSWERLEEDAANLDEMPCDYSAKDLVRRAKALAERE